jgi:O-antigen/teichoic acid export membrane protein
MLTAGRKVLVNSFWNVAGDLAPMAFALVAIPIVIRVLGTAQYGILSLATAVINSMAFFDLGLSLALTKFVSSEVAAGRPEEIPRLFWGCLPLSLAFGVIAGAILFLFVPQVVELLNVPPTLSATAGAVFRVLALMVPLLIVNSALQAFIAAFQRFDLLTAVRVPAGVSVFLGPLAVLPFSHSLVAIVTVLLLSRALAGLAYLTICFRLFPRLRSEPWTDRGHMLSLMAFGGWVSVTNLVVAAMLYGDRFLVSGILSIGAVAYYTTPYDTIVKLSTIPGAVCRAFFPAFTEGFALSTGRAVVLLQRGSNLILLSIGPVILIALVLAPQGLNLWLGPVFAAKSTPVLRWLAIGVLVNATALMPLTLIQAAHRPDLPAKLHAIEVPFYLIAEYVFIRIWGVEGAAITWSVRVIIDTVVVWVIAGWIIPGTRAIAVRMAAGIGAVLGLAAIGIWLPFSLAGQLVFVAAAIAISLSAGWLFLLSGEDRRQINAWSAELFFSKAA